MHEYLHHFRAARNTSPSGPRAADQFSQFFLVAAKNLWNLLKSGVFNDSTLSSFKSAICLQRA